MHGRYTIESIASDAPRTVDERIDPGYTKDNLLGEAALIRIEADFRDKRGL